VRQYHRPGQLADVLFEDIRAYIDKKYPQVRGACLMAVATDLAAYGCR